MGELSADVLAAVAKRLESLSKQPYANLDELIRSTKFSKQEIRTMYRGFKQECPGGAVNEVTFKEIYEKFFPYGNATCYAHHVFKAFDVNCRGAITFRDLLVSLSTLLHGTQYEKLYWTFRVYDLNGDGIITKEELGNVVVGIYELMGVNILPPTGSLINLDYIPRRRDSLLNEEQNLFTPKVDLSISVRELRSHVESIFNRLDKNRDGMVTREEFILSCSQDPVIKKSLQNFQLKL